MFAGLWTGVAGKLAERWAAAILSPAFVFWAGGALAWADNRNTGSIEVAIDDLTGDLQDLSTATEAAVIVTALLLVMASGIVVQGLANWCPPVARKRASEPGRPIRPSWTRLDHVSSAVEALASPRRSGSARGALPLSVAIRAGARR